MRGDPKIGHWSIKLAHGVVRECQSQVVGLYFALQERWNQPIFSFPLDRGERSFYARFVLFLNISRLRHFSSSDTPYSDVLHVIDRPAHALLLSGESHSCLLAKSLGLQCGKWRQICHWRVPVQKPALLKLQAAAGHFSCGFQDLLTDTETFLYSPWQIMLQEAIAIVMAPTDSQRFVLSLPLCCIWKLKSLGSTVRIGLVHSSVKSTTNKCGGDKFQCKSVER